MPADVLAQVSTALDARLREFDVRVAGAASGTYPYVVTYVSSPLTPTTDLGDSRTTLVFSINTVTVGETKEQCTALLGRVTDALHRWRPDAGTVAWRVTHSASMPPAPDDDLPDRRVWSARDAWSLAVAA